MSWEHPVVTCMDGRIFGGWCRRCSDGIEGAISDQVKYLDELIALHEKLVLKEIDNGRYDDVLAPA